MRHVKTAVLGAIVALVLGACGGASSDNSTDASDASGAENVGAAVGSIFGGETDMASLEKKHLILSRVSNLFFRQAVAQMESPTACEVVESGDGPPEDVSTSLSITAGTYGMTGATVELEASDGCDQGGEYAGFTLESHSLDCVDGDGTETTVTMVDSQGVWRENLDTSTTEIYGTFSVQVEGETFSAIRCSLTITHGDEGEGEFGGDCEDSEGAVLEQASETTCTQNE